ncbi:hypothetical protein V5O48_013696 [Marasmius crinis-equi]|uniref:Ricin B lectin domain-containing protein n=1 Tax=Marasmius crinis-equi TaxID=585013 RepID=A0ABR3EZE3_9AGAR
MSYHSGKTYKLINAKTDGALDLSTEDNFTVACWDSHDGHQQRWTLEEHNGHWSFRNGNGKYLGLAGMAQEGTPVAGVDHAYEWDIWPDEQDGSVFRIFVPGAPPPGQNLDLSDHGNPAGGTRVTLWTKWEGRHQCWRFQEVCVIFGRAIKNEHLVLGVLGTVFGGSYLATRGGSKKQEPPSTIEKIKQAIPINAGSSEEEQLMASIKNFIAEAERADGAAGGSKH